MSHEISKRKQAHLDICLTKPVESGTTEFSSIHLLHNALPELNIENVSTAVEFLGQKITAPIFISCMTGGSNHSYDYNKRFAETAEQLGIPVGLGSIRILLEHEHMLPEFQLKRIAPSVPLIANIGAAQLRTTAFSALNDIIKELNADALAIHLNPAQELCQQSGERSFENIFDVIKEYISYSSIPIIVKETGCGILPQEVHSLLNIGANYVDIAGSGGTNWALVELFREASENIEDISSLQTFSQWGNSTGLILLALYGTKNIISSGGVRSAYDVTVSLALGAKMVGLALPMLQHANSSVELTTYVSKLIEDIKRLLLLSKARTVEEMQQATFWIEPHLLEKLKQFCKACQIQVPKKFEIL